MSRAEYQREYRARNREKFAEYERSRPPRSPRKRNSQPRESDVIGIDGEGYTTPDGRHLYTYVAACTENQLISDMHLPKGIDAEALFEWLLALPKSMVKVGFALNYDFCKWVESLEDDRIYALTHPEIRRQGGRIRPVGIPSRNAPTYLVDKVSTRFAVKRPTDKRWCVVWDVFKFFQSSFVKALGLWDVGTKEEVDRIAAMKAKRGNFQDIGQDEQLYCQRECMLLASLMKKLVQSHQDAGLELTTYYGPGSTAALMLAAMNAEEEKQLPISEKNEPDPEHAFACAFFGGRFECSAVGPVERPLYSYDIASAYPYAMARLPCMRHGTWRFYERDAAEKRFSKATTKLACVQYRIDPDPKCVAWGPLPHRLADGNIVFPVVSAGGWAWLPEILAGRKIHSGIVVLGAWILEGKCKCSPPFRKGIIDFYGVRLRWGKDGKGLVSKLGLNSCYGKTAQRVGSARFRNPVIAGMITSLTRAMLLDAIACAKDPWDVVEVATDSITSMSPLKLAAPIKLGTEKAVSTYGGKTLGTWEGKDHPKGLFLIRPGLRFSLDPDAATKTTAARGLGTNVLHENRQKILETWQRGRLEDLHVQQPTMFWGAKSSIRRKLGEPGPDGSCEYEYVRDEKYGRWQRPEPRLISYAAGPKRESVVDIGSPWLRLSTWSLPQTPEAVSCAYGETPAGPLAVEAMALRDLEEEQPESFGLGGVAGDE